MALVAVYYAIVTPTKNYREAESKMTSARVFFPSAFLLQFVHLTKYIFLRAWPPSPSVWTSTKYPTCQSFRLRGPISLLSYLQHVKNFSRLLDDRQTFFEILIFSDIRLAFARHSSESGALSSGSSCEHSSGETILSRVSVSTTLFFCLTVFITLINGGCRPLRCVCKKSHSFFCLVPYLASHDSMYF